MGEIQRVEVDVNGTIHRRPDRSSERCCCGFDPSVTPWTWLEHVVVEILRADHRAAGGSTENPGR